MNELVNLFHYFQIRNKTESNEEIEYNGLANFPIELLCTIGSHLKEPSDRFNYTILSKRFHPLTLDLIKVDTKYMEKLFEKSLGSDLPFSKNLRLSLSTSILNLDIHHNANAYNVSFPKVTQLTLRDTAEVSSSQFQQILSNCPNLTSITVKFNTKDPKEYLHVLSEMCPNLLELNIYNEINEETAKIIESSFPQLESFSLKESSQEISDEFFQNHRNLRKCTLGPAVTLSGKELFNIHTIEEIEVYTLPLSDEELVDFAKCAKNLRKFDVSNLPSVTAVDTLPTFFSQCHELESIGVSKCTDVTAQQIAQSCTNLKVLHLTMSEITDDGFEKIVTSLPHLQSLKLLCCNQLSPKSGALIANNLKELKNLHIERCENLDIENVDTILIGSENLTKLNLRGYKKPLKIKDGTLKKFVLTTNDYFDDDALIQLALTCKNKLKKIDLRRCTKITKEGVKSLFENCRKLQKVHLPDTITFDCMRSLSENLPKTIRSLSCEETRKGNSQWRQSRKYITNKKPTSLYHFAQYGWGGKAVKFACDLMQN